MYKLILDKCGVEYSNNLQGYGSKRSGVAVEMAVGTTCNTVTSGYRVKVMAMESSRALSPCRRSEPLGDAAAAGHGRRGSPLCEF
jgi:hypothetical protein